VKRGAQVFFAARKKSAMVGGDVRGKMREKKSPKGGKVAKARPRRKKKQGADKNAKPVPGELLEVGPLLDWSRPILEEVDDSLEKTKQSRCTPAQQVPLKASLGCAGLGSETYAAKALPRPTSFGASKPAHG
jgi:hypothetical protein